MQQEYVFGLNAEIQQGTAIDGFVEIKNVAGTQQNHNPYGAAYFNDPSQMALTPDDAKVTSIPSPYARMHITDIAFREMMAGVGVMTKAQHEEHIRNMSGDYLKAMSHCLDLYEMMFHFNDLDLIDKGISIKRIDLVSKRDGRFKDLLDGNKSLSCFIDTLDLFRQRYLQDIRNRNVINYKFDFTQMYLFKYKGETFAATSPFTGFFAKADCNLSEAGISVSWGNKTHKLFTNTPKEWLGLQDRDPEFVKFMYLLLKDELGTIFTHLFEAIKDCINDTRSLDNLRFEELYPKFNFGAQELPKIAGNTQNESYIRPDGLDCSYLKYILYLREPVDLAISEDAYNREIEDRVFPEGTENRVPWIGVNDFLSDALIVLPYDINDNYYAVEYIDENLNPHRRCLLPLKRKALNYLDIETVVNKLAIRKYSDTHYAVTLTLDLTTGGKVDLRRDYYSAEENECVFPNGALVDMQKKNKHFAFGIYPFVRSKDYENIYKVLFYNDFKWPEAYHPQPGDKLYDLNFYYFDNQHHATVYDKDTKVKHNQTNKADKDFDVNTHYYQVTDKLRVNNEYISIDFAELTLTVIKNPHKGNPTKINATAIIAPKYHDVAYSDGKTTIAIDLGTSNTFIAYEHEGEGAREISTIHDGWNELTLMNCHCTRDNANDINRDDLYLETSDKSNEVDDTCLAAQLCEFIPTRIKQGREAQEIGYKFPIPSVINNLRINGKQNSTFTDRIALVHSAIPFAYYSMGKRPNTEANNYDSMSNGEFKWFYRKKDESGLYEFDNERLADFNSFLRELMFIVRSHMLCRGIKLDQCTLLWTYPLSFQPELIEYYQHAWTLAYCQYFNPSFLTPDRNNIIDEDDSSLKDLVKYTNESRSPIYECIDNPADANHLTILMDIGGGSTDVIGYKHQQPVFITSFGFAGNSLYLGGSMNHKEFGVEIDKTDKERKETNYMRDLIKRTCNNVFDKDKDNNSTEKKEKKSTQKIDLLADINTLMNYGFSEASTEFKAIFHNERVQFMLQFHNAALVYHTAQLCKLKSADEMPVKVFLTGNGSKLFALGKNKALITKIFNEVYGNEKEITVPSESPRYPKAATAIGSLKGNKKTGQNKLKFNEESSEEQIVMLGDDKTLFVKDNDRPTIEVADTSAFPELVKQNVLNFIDIFFKVYNVQTPFFKKEDVIGCLEYVENDPMLEFSTTLSDSMFFQYIALTMEQLSIKMVKH